MTLDAISSASRAVERLTPPRDLQGTAVAIRRYSFAYVNLAALPSSSQCECFVVYMVYI